jgi:hypothetical protein
MAPLQALERQPQAKRHSCSQEDKDMKVLPATKMVATIGPESRDVETLEKLLNAGMAVSVALALHRAAGTDAIDMYDTGLT